MELVAWKPSGSLPSWEGRLQGLCGIGCSLQNCREGYNLMNVVGSQ